jgi:hypothetical protein
MYLSDPPDSGAVDLSAYRFGIPVTIHGHEYLMMADHGSNVSLLASSTVDRVGIRHKYADASRADTVVRRRGVNPVIDSTAEVVVTRGDTSFLYWGVSDDPAILDSLRVGRAKLDSVAFTDEEPASFLTPFDGLVGRDVLTEFDIEFDLPNRAIRLYAIDTSSARRPRLPPGFRENDCLAADIVRMPIDSSGADSADLAELHSTPLKRIISGREMRVPVSGPSGSIDGIFDSGAGGTIMNWAAAKALGVDRARSKLRVSGSGNLTSFQFEGPAAATDSVPAVPIDTMNYLVSGVELRVAGRPLPIDDIVISDATFGGRAKGPAMLLGVRHVRERRLLFAYSSSRICVANP